MKKFYDREKEIRQLLNMQNQAYSDCSRFVVLAGRRRVGKTSLVYKVMQETKTEAPGLYFFVGRKTEAILVKSFIEEVRNVLGEYIPEGLRSFRELFQMLLEISKRRAFTVFIDEFQEFDNVNSGIFSDMQELWDKYKKIGAWWQNADKKKNANAKGNADEFQIDIVTVTIDDEIEAYEVKRKIKRYSPTRLEEKIEQMQRHTFKNKVIKPHGLSMEDMETNF